MKRSFAEACSWMLVVFLVLLLSGGPALAGGIINKQNQSADYMRTLNRNAATDYADIASYNPAGIMQMEDGMYAKLDLMYFSKDYSNDVPDSAFGSTFDQSFGELDQDDPSIIPGVFAVYKKKKWAGFFALTIPAGGGTLNYEDGNVRTIALADGVAQSINGLLVNPVFYYNNIEDMEIEVKQSTVYGFTAGASYAINAMWSVAAGVRFSKGVREFDGFATISADNAAPSPPFPPGINDTRKLGIHLEEDAAGWAGIVGVNFAPSQRLNAAVTFISNTQMEYEMDVKGDSTLPDGSSLAEAIGYGDGSKRRIDIPPLLGLGLSYKVTPELKIDLNYTYYLEKAAEIDTYDDEGNSWDLGISAEYTFNPHWKASVGYMRTDVQIDDDQQINEPEEPKLDADTIAAGVVWSPGAAWAVTLGGAYVMYQDVEDQLGINYDKTVVNVSIGLQYKFF